jgi:small subunit ribosomal protein S21
MNNKPVNASVTLRPDESLERAIKRFTKAVNNSGALEECYRRRYYEKPSVRRRRKKAESAHRVRKANKKNQELNDKG